MPAAMVEALDAYAAKAKSTRSAVVRQFIEAGLKRRLKA
jgi:metal-responsive CopG/Arc/MetJ family transcriptional regulator